MANLEVQPPFFQYQNTVRASLSHFDLNDLSEKPTPTPNQLLIQASRNNFVKKIENILSIGNLNINYKSEILNDKGKTALHLACECGHLEAVQLLIDSGADINARDENDWTPLHYASRGSFLMRVLEGRCNSVYSIAFSPNNRNILSSDELRVWRVQTGVQIKQLEGEAKKILSVAYSCNGKWIACGTADAHVYMFNALKAGQTRWSFEANLLNENGGHTDAVKSVAFDPAGNVLASASSDRTVRLWDTLSGRYKLTLQHTNSVMCVAFSNDGQYIASAGVDSLVWLWLSDSGEALHQFSGHSGPVSSVCFSYDDALIISGSQDKSIKIWGTNTREIVQSLEGHTNWVNSVACSSDGKLIVSGSDDKSVRFWSARNGKLLRHIETRHKRVLSVAFSSDGKMVASAGEDSEDSLIRIWNAELDDFPYLELTWESFWAQTNSVESSIYRSIQPEHGSQVDKQEFSPQINLYPDQVNATQGVSLNAHQPQQRHVQIVQLLLDCFADTSALTKDTKQTALDLSVENERADDAVAIQMLLYEVSSLSQKDLQVIPSSAEKQRPFFLIVSGNHLRASCFRDLAASVCTVFLTSLNLDNNPNFGCVTESIRELTALRALSMANCGLTATHIINISLCTWLRILNLSNNKLKDLPNEFVGMWRLCRLTLAQCDLTTIPTCVIQLPQLCYLNLSGNPIDHLPVALARMRSIKVVILTGCSLTHFSSSLATASTAELLEFLRNESQRQFCAFRCKLLFVGYGGVGKTTLCHSLFPPQGFLQKRMKGYFGYTYYYWEKHLCQIRGTDFVESVLEGGLWKENQQLISLRGSEIRVSSENASEFEWSIKTAADNRFHLFRCGTLQEREEWVRAARFHARNAATDGVIVSTRTIPSSELSAALATPRGSEAPRSAPTYLPRVNRVPAEFVLQLSIWDFAGQQEYQDGHSLFFGSQAVYLVLWDLTPSRRSDALAELRHWLSTLQLHLGSADEQIRLSTLIYIVGTHVDLLSGDYEIEECNYLVEQAVTEVGVTLPHRIHSGIDTRHIKQVQALRDLLLSDFAVQPHLGELVPQSYLDLEKMLHRQQVAYRSLSIEQRSLPLATRNHLASALHVHPDVVTDALTKLHSWGDIAYFGHPMLQDLVVIEPEWLTVSILGGLMGILRPRIESLKQKGYMMNDSPVVKHKDLARLPLWNRLTLEQRKQIIFILVAFDLALPYEESADFEEQSSFLPLLLPLLPSSQFSWAPNPENTRDLVVVLKLNGIPMGFHGVLLSRISQTFHKKISYQECWRSGFKVFPNEIRNSVVLLTIHDDKDLIRICVRSTKNDQQPHTAQMFIQVIQELQEERYKGLRIDMLLECPCNSCKVCKWRWDDQIAHDLDPDVNEHVQRFRSKTGSKQELAAVVAKRIYRDGKPHLFSWSQLHQAFKQEVYDLICDHKSQAVNLKDEMHMLFPPGIIDVDNGHTDNSEFNRGFSFSPRASRSSSINASNATMKRSMKQRFALVIGNNYNQGLINAVNDATQIGKRFEELGFCTEKLLNGRAREMKGKISEWIKNACNLTSRYNIMLASGQQDPNRDPEFDSNPDLLLAFYYSGHACQVDGINYLIPEDECDHIRSDDDVRNYCISLKELFTEVISNSPNMKKHLIVILDACRSKMQHEPLKRDFFDTSLSDMVNAATFLNRYLFFSTQANMVAIDDGEYNGPFARALLKYLNKHRKLGDVAIAVTNEVMNAPRTTPLQQPIFTASGSVHIVL